MTITSIKLQVKRGGYYSVFVDDKYEFSLSDRAILDAKLIKGQSLSEEQLGQYKQLSSDDKIYNRALSYISLRRRTKWEIEIYLKQKKVSPALVTLILNKLSNNDLINDEKFAHSFVNDRLLLRPTSIRKLSLELKQKHVQSDIIQKVIGDLDKAVECSSLRAVIESKRRQTRYKDDLKLMQYLVRQGFNYGDVKKAIKAENSDF
jgi:regulatory protein